MSLFSSDIYQWIAIRFFSFIDFTLFADLKLLLVCLYQVVHNYSLSCLLYIMMSRYVRHFVLCVHASHFSHYIIGALYKLYCMIIDILILLRNRYLNFIM